LKSVAPMIAPKKLLSAYRIRGKQIRYINAALVQKYELNLKKRIILKFYFHRKREKIEGLHPVINSTINEGHSGQ